MAREQHYDQQREGRRRATQRRRRITHRQRKLYWNLTREHDNLVAAGGGRRGERR